MKRICLILVLCMIFSLLGGCGASNAPSDTTLGTVEPATVPTTLPPETLPPETTVPTTLPPETEPTETGTPLPHRHPATERAKAMEEKFDLEFYTSPGMYTLREPGREFDFQDGSGVKLTIPESWEDRVVVFEVVNDHPAPEPWIGSITIVGKSLMEAYWKNNLTALDYTITLQRADKDAYYCDDGNWDAMYRTCVEEGTAAVVAEDDNFVYIVYTDQSFPPIIGDPMGGSRDELKAAITEEGYQQAVGDITCTLEEAAAMCSVETGE